MNQASWRRILQRAGDEVPGESAAIINMQDHVPGSRRGPQPLEARATESADLDYQLSRALDRAGRRSRSSGQPKPPPSAPLTARNPYVSMQPVPLPLPPQNGKKAGSGLRNIVAISLSVAVVGLAFHQISAQWSESRSGSQSADMAQVSEPQLPPVLFTGAASTEVPSRPADESPRSAASNNKRVELRPSLAEPEAAPAAAGDDRQALYAEMEQAVKSYLEKEASEKKAAAPSQTVPANAPAQPKARVAANTPATAPIVGTNSEQTMLRRGRDLMERGHVAGARLIFEHLAAQNSALGAFALAQTYDPRYINQNSLSGAAPDEALAARWYQRAIELGSINGG